MNRDASRGDTQEPSDVGIARLSHDTTGTGDPLLLLMGLGAPGAAWAPHVNAWSTTFTCITVDNRGTGNSAVTEGLWTTAEMADDAAALLRQLETGPVRVAGISMGGAIAQELALRHPDLVRQLVITASWARSTPWLSQVLATLDTAHATLSPAEFTRLLQLIIWTPAYVDAHLDELAVVREEATVITRHAFSAQASACRTHDTLSRLASIKAPVLVTSGARDAFAPLPLGQELAAGLPAARLEVFADSAHAHHWEELDRYNDLVGSWLG